MTLGTKINLASPIDPLELYKNLSRGYFDEVDKVIALRLPQTILIHGASFAGATEVIDGVLKDSVDKLKEREIVPGAGIFWDDKRNKKPAYKYYPVVVVDVVDGSRELRRGGTEVTSTLAIVLKDESIPFAVISYPFGREKIVDINGEVYRLPNNVLDELDINPDIIVKYKLSRRESRSALSELRVSERYENFRDKRRKKLDSLRLRLDASMRRPFGSLTKSLMYLVVGTCDIFMARNRDREPYHFYDTLAASKVITDLGGVFTDLDGNEREGLNDMNGIIAASTKKNYELFVRFMKRK